MTGPQYDLKLLGQLEIPPELVVARPTSGRHAFRGGPCFNNNNTRNVIIYIQVFTRAFADENCYRQDQCEGHQNSVFGYRTREGSFASPVMIMLMPRVLKRVLATKKTNKQPQCPEPLSFSALRPLTPKVLLNLLRP